MQSRSNSAFLLVSILVALLTLVIVGVVRDGRAPRAGQRLQRSDVAGAAVPRSPDDLGTLVAVDGSPATRDALPASPSVAAEQSSNRSATSVSVLVRRVDERLASPGVEGVAVSYVGDGGKRAPAARLGVTDARGELRAAVPGPGRYELFIDPADVPEGLVAPGRFFVPGPTAPGVAETIVQVARGEEASAVLYLNDARVLAGRLLGPDGMGLAGAVLRAAAIAPGHQRVCYDFESGEDGVFSLVSALPLEYVLEVIDLRAHTEALGALPLPASQLVDLHPGDVRDLVLRVAPGRHLLTGTIVDERGEPFPGIDVLAYYSSVDPVRPGPREGSYATTWNSLVGTAVSDARGKFELGPVHSASLRLVVAAQAARAAGRGERLVAFGVDPIDVPLDASAATRIDVGRVELTRSRTYSVSGTITLAPGSNAKLLKLEVTGAALVPRPSLAGRWGVQGKPHVKFDPVTGDFELSCDGWHERVELVVTQRGQRSTEQRFEFVPEPDGEREGVVLEFP